MKGIMLAERPGNLAPGENPAFVPSCATEKLEPMGLTPVRKLYPHEPAPKPPSVNTAHKKWVQKLDSDLKQQQELDAAAQAQQIARAQQLADFSAKLRTTILAGKDVSTWTARRGTHAQASTSGTSDPAHGTSSQVKQPAAGLTVLKEQLQLDAMQFVENLIQQAQQQQNRQPEADQQPPCPVQVPPDPPTCPTQPSTATAPSQVQSCNTPTSGPRPSTTSKPQQHKPAWALSSGEASAVQDQEEAGLLAFAEGLDLDRFLTDLEDPEFKDCLQELSAAEQGGGPGGSSKAWSRTFVRAMNHVALRKAQAAAQASQGGGGDRAGSDTCHTLCSRHMAVSAGRSEGVGLRDAAAAGAGAKGWDGSSVAGGDVARMEAVQAASAQAEEFLRENPDLKGVYSKASVMAALLKHSEHASPT